MKKPYIKDDDVTYNMITSHPYFKSLSFTDLRYVVNNMNWNGYMTIPGERAGDKALFLTKKFNKDFPLPEKWCIQITEENKWMFREEEISAGDWVVGENWQYDFQTENPANCQIITSLEFYTQYLGEKIPEKWGIECAYDDYALRYAHLVGDERIEFIKTRKEGTVLSDAHFPSHPQHFTAVRLEDIDVYTPISKDLFNLIASGQMSSECFHPDVNIRIGCSTQDEFNTVLSIFEIEGLRWRSGDKPLELASRYWRDTSDVSYIRLSYDHYISLCIFGKDEENNDTSGVIPASTFISSKLPNNNSIKFNDLTNKPMKKAENFTISGSLALQIAFLKETSSTYFEGIPTLERDYADYPKLVYKGEKSYEFASSCDRAKATFSLPEDYQKAKEHLESVRKEEETIEMDGYTAEFGDGKVAFGCNVLSKEDLQAMRGVITLCSRLGYSELSVNPDSISVTGNESRTFNTALIDRLLAKL